LSRKGLEHDDLDSIAAWGIWVAAGFDLVENGSMGWILWLQQDSLVEASPWLDAAAFVGAICALIKWTLVTAICGHTLWRFWKWGRREWRRLTTPPADGGGREGANEQHAAPPEVAAHDPAENA